MGRKKCWEQNFDSLKNFGLLDPNKSKKWLFGDFFDFLAQQIEKMSQKRVKIKNLFPTFFQICLYLGLLSQFLAQMVYLG